MDSMTPAQAVQVLADAYGATEDEKLILALMVTPGFTVATEDNLAELLGL